MPLIKCPDCGKDFSDSAAACPNCGRPNKAPVKKSMGCFSIGCLSLIVLAIIGHVASQSSGSGGGRSTPAGSNPPPEMSAPKLELESWTWHIEYDYAVAEGVVKNISGESLRSVTAVVTFRTKDGTFVTSDDALIDFNPILPGQSSPFKVMTRDNPAMKTAGIDFKYLMGGSISWREKPKKR